MVDKLSQSDRSQLMGRVRSKDTKPEMAVRRCAHRLGNRFRLHRKDLPGNPDIVFRESGRSSSFTDACGICITASVRKYLNRTPSSGKQNFDVTPSATLLPSRILRRTAGLSLLFGSAKHAAMIVSLNSYTVSCDAGFCCCISRYL